MKAPLLVLLVIAGIALAAFAWLSSPDGATPPAPGEATTTRIETTAEGLATEKRGEDSGAPAREVVGTEPSLTGVDNATTADGAIIGRVIDAAGQPVAGAEVVRNPSPEFDRAVLRTLIARRATEPEPAEAAFTVTTDRDGRFRLPTTGAATRLEVRARGYLKLERRVESASEPEIDLGDLRLARGAIVSGRVVDANGRGIAGADVSLRQPSTEAPFDFGLEALRRGQESTDASGAFELASVPPGEWVVRARHPEHPPTSSPAIEVRAGETHEGMLLVLAAGASIAGRVSDVPDGVDLRVIARKKPDVNEAAANPMAALLGDPSEIFEGFGLALGDRTVDLGDDGSFELHGLEASTTYRIWATGTDPNVHQVGACTERLEVPAGSKGVQLRYAPGITVSFRAVDAESGRPIEDLTVLPRLLGGGGLMDVLAGGIMFGGAGSQRQHYPDGRVVLADLRPKPNQRLHLTVSALGHVDLQREKIELPEHGTLDLGTLALTSAPILRVHVSSAATGEPIAGAVVGLEPVDDEEPQSGARRSISFTAAASAGMSARAGDAPVAFSPGRFGSRTEESDESGWCELTSTPGERIRIAVQAAGFAGYVSEAMLLPANDIEHRARLVTGATVEIVVQDHLGEPVPNAHVVRRGPPEEDNDNTDARGVVRFSNLTPGRHGFRLHRRYGPLEAPGGVRTSMRVDMGEASTDHLFEWHDLVDGQTLTLILTRPPAARLTGTLTEAGRPLSGASISFAEGEASGDVGEAQQRRMLAMLPGMPGAVKTDGDGAFEFEDLPAGSHRLWISHRERAMPDEVTVHLREGDNQQTFDLELNVIRGRVVDAAGEPIARARVIVNRHSDEAGQRMTRALSALQGFGFGDTGTRTDDTGEFELRGVPGGVPLVVNASASDFTSEFSDVIRVQNGVARDGVVIALRAAGAILVRAPGVSFAGVRARPADEPDDAEGDNMGAFAMVRAGQARLEGLAPGSYRVELSLPTDEKRSEVVEVVAGEVAKVTFPQ